MKNININATFHAVGIYIYIILQNSTKPKGIKQIKKRKNKVLYNWCGEKQVWGKTWTSSKLKHK